MHSPYLKATLHGSLFNMSYFDLLLLMTWTLLNQRLHVGHCIVTFENPMPSHTSDTKSCTLPLPKPPSFPDLNLITLQHNHKDIPLSYSVVHPPYWTTSPPTFPLTPTPTPLPISPWTALIHNLNHHLPISLTRTSPQRIPIWPWAWTRHLVHLAPNNARGDGRTRYT